MTAHAKQDGSCTHDVVGPGPPFPSGVCESAEVAPARRLLLLTPAAAVAASATDAALRGRVKHEGCSCEGGSAGVHAQARGSRGSRSRGAPLRKRGACEIARERGTRAAMRDDDERLDLALQRSVSAASAPQGPPLQVPAHVAGQRTPHCPGAAADAHAMRCGAIAGLGADEGRPSTASLTRAPRQRVARAGCAKADRHRDCGAAQGGTRHSSTAGT